MIVYGDRERNEPCGAAFARVHALLAAQSALSSLERARAAELAIECGKLAQGLLDLEFQRRGSDELTDLTEACAALCLAAGRSFVGAPLSDVRAALQRCESCARELAGTTIAMREPEGYAYYALYPELYVHAARALASSGPVQVIGIRSIGTSLAGFVAAALHSSRLPFTVRPTGHPFTRELRVAERLTRALLVDREQTQYLIVDEGPGMSGSSFLAVARFLLERGVQREQIALLPSHTGEPGAESAESTRELYAALRRSVVTFEQLFDQRAITGWFHDQTGDLDGPPSDLAGGRWRALAYPAGAALPASHVRDERRKYLLSGKRAWLMKYVGLGSGAEQIVARLQRLSAGRYTPELLSHRHGFILSEWLEEARPLPLVAIERESLVEHVSDYLSFLSMHFPVSERAAGATPKELFALLDHNARELLGSERAKMLLDFEPKLASLGASHRATATDNKLDAHEWLVLADGSLRKCDAEAHHRAHDCIGAQDSAWDVAGATVELGLTDSERERVLRALRDRAGLSFDETKLRFYELCYLAFRAGHAHYAERALTGAADDDAARFRAAKQAYSARLAQLMSAAP